MNFKSIKKEIIGGVAAAVAVCVAVTAIPWNFSGEKEQDAFTTEFSHIKTSAGANASILNTEDSMVAGAFGAVSNGTADIVDVDKDVVGQPSDEETDAAEGSTEETTETTKPEYKTFGYTNLGLADVEGNLNVRKKASTSSSVVGKLTRYAACEILGEEDGWYQIKSGKVEGYVSAEYIITGDAAWALAQTEARVMATVTTNSLRVRKEASISSEKLANVAKGEELNVVEILDGWVKVEMEGYKEAYVSADYVKVEEKLKTGSTMEELRYGAGVADIRVQLVNYALQFVGNRYVWGGNSLTKGVDCSGFTQQVYKKFGIKLPRTSRTQPSAGKKIKASQAKPGDLFFYGDSKGINHVAIYIGNGKIVHASNPKDGIKISNAYYSTPKCVVTYFND